MSTKDLQNIHEKVMINRGMNINRFMDEKNDVRTLWINHFKLPVGWYFALKEAVLKWRNSYSGLTDSDQRRIERFKKREEIARRKLALESSSEVENDVELG